jgi:hypothetical protein
MKCRKDSSVMIDRIRQQSSSNPMPEHGKTMSGKAWSATRWLAASTVMSSMAVLGAAGAWTLSDDGFGARAIGTESLGAGPLAFTRQSVGGQAAFALSRPSAGDGPFPLMLTGVSGETLAAMAPRAAVFAAPPALGGRSKLAVQGSAPLDPNAAVADYALVFPQTRATIQPVSLQAGWAAVVETLVLTGEPKPAVVNNL